MQTVARTDGRTSQRSEIGHSLFPRVIVLPRDPTLTTARHMTSVEPPVPSKAFEDGCHLSLVHHSAVRFSGQPSADMSNIPQCPELHFTPHSTQEKKLRVTPEAWKSSGPQSLPTTDRDSGQVSPSLEGSASPCDTKTPTYGAVEKSVDNRGQNTMWQNHTQTQPACRGPGPAARWERDHRLLLPAGPGRRRAPQAAASAGQLGRHSCSQALSSESDHMRIYNPSWGLGSINLNSLAPEMQVPQRGAGSISSFKIRVSWRADLRPQTSHGQLRAQVQKRKAAVEVLRRPHLGGWRRFGGNWKPSRPSLPQVHVTLKLLV